MPLGRLLGALGRLSGSLGRFLSSSWVLLGRSWASLSSSRTPLGRILPPQDLPNLDFGGSGSSNMYSFSTPDVSHSFFKPLLGELRKMIELTSMELDLFSHFTLLK